MSQNKTPSLQDLKTQVEQQYPDFPSIDVTAPDFDIEAYLETLRSMMSSMGIPLDDVAVSWKNLSCTVPVQPPSRAIDTVISSFQNLFSNIKNGFSNLAHNLNHPTPTEAPVHADVLSDVSGFVAPASMCLVLGRSGSGSTLLLSRLASRDHPSIIHSAGEVLYNGKPRLFDTVDPAHFIYFISQHDDHIPTLTVGQTLEFSSACKWPPWFPHYEAVRRNDIAITAATLRIAHTFDTIVGSDVVRGVSGGERKRVTMAEMAIGMIGGVLIMDNWSKGLDSSTTLSITRAMRDFAQYLRGTVICSMQAPGIDSFNLFDTLLVLDAGHVVFFGPRQEAEQWFTSLGFVRPQSRSVPDFIATITDPALRHEYLPSNVDVASMDLPPPETAEEFASRFANSAIAERMEQEREKLTAASLEINPTMPQQILKIGQTPSVQAPYQEIKAIARRQLHWYASTRADVFGDLALNFMLGVILGSIFWQLPDTRGGADSRSGLLFLAMLFIALSSLAKIDEKFDEKVVFAKQYNAAFYSAWTYILSLTFFDIMYELIKTVLFIVPLYIMSGLNLGSSAQRLLYAILIIAMLSSVMIALTRFFIAIFEDKDTAKGISGIITIVLVLFSGFLKNANDLEGYLIWLYWSNPMHYTFEALALNEFEGLTFTCTTEELLPPNPNIPDAFRVCPVDTGVNFLDTNLGIRVGKIFRLYDFIILLAFLVLFVFLSAIATSRSKPRGHALQSRIEGKKKLASDLGEDTSTVVHIQEPPSHKPQTRFTFTNIKYTVNNGAKVLLDNISGSAVSGKVVLLMGESGAGKSTLLDVCAMRKTLKPDTSLEGTALVNSRSVSEDELSHLSGYCEQNDIHVGEATVYEAVLFSAKLRLPAHLSDVEKNNRALDTIELLGLTPFSDILVGSLGAGELKLLTMAVEVVTDPRILFLDEPTSGISASSALTVANALRRIANTGTSVICTVHQPSTEVFSKFDKLLLLKRGGKQVYFGDIGVNGSVIRDYFESRGGQKLQKDTNPADWMLDVVGDDSIDWVEEWRKSAEREREEDEIESLVQIGQGDGGDITEPFDRVSFGTQLKEVTRRTFWRYWRLPEYNLTRIILVTMVALSVGILYLREITDTQQGARLAFSAMFLSVLPASLVAQNVITPTVENRAVFYRETSSGTYNPLVFHIALGAVEVPFMTAATIAFSVVFYFMVGLDAGSFGYFFLAAEVIYLFAIALGIMMASITENGALATTRVTALVSIFDVLSGFFLTKPRIRAWWRWFVWVNPYAYYLSGVVQNQMEGRVFRCEPDEFGFLPLPDTVSSCAEIIGGQYTDVIEGGVVTGCAFCPVPNGDVLIEQFEADDVDKWISLLIIVGFIAVCRVVAGLGFVQLRFLSR